MIIDVQQAVSSIFTVYTRDMSHAKLFISVLAGRLTVATATVSAGIVTELAEHSLLSDIRLI
jgi:hypothetical protein